MADPRTGILVILDGFGVNPNSHANAIAQAKAPTLQRLLKQYPHTTLEASEGHVGLPEGFMGNSEVGHLNIGAGRVVYQDFSLISRAIEDRTFFQNEKFLQLFEKVNAHPGHALHLMGLVSDGGVHSHISHLYALLEAAKENKVREVYVHAFLDGRDTSPTSAVNYLRELKAFIADAGIGEIASITGRFYAMDRDNRWERTEAAYRALVLGNKDVAMARFSDAEQYVRAEYAANITDEFVNPAVSSHFEGIRDGDGIIFFNFRADRARQITRALTDAEFSAFRRSAIPHLAGFVCMTPYDSSFGLPTAYEKAKVPNTLGEYLSGLGWKQLRIAETEKYAHVTYFFNGGEEKVFEGEKRVLVPSPREVKTYDLKPEMSAKIVVDRLLEELAGGFQFVVVNFANPDMVGHTGNLSAAIKAVETVDECLAKIVNWVERCDAFAVITADHGNCEMMQDDSGMPMTAHTTLPVPLIIADPKLPRDTLLQKGGKLSDIAPTLLALWKLPPPAEMTGRSLVSLR